MTFIPSDAARGSIDLHTHSRASDGSLAPAALVDRAAQRGVRWLALTDHDTVDGLAEAGEAARCQGIAFVPGVEVSVTWENRTLHILGLAVDASHGTLRRGLAQQRTERQRRAEAMDAALRRAGIEGALDGATQAGCGAIGRGHFADFLVRAGHARHHRDAFRRWLGRGRPGYVGGRWAPLEEALGWLRESGAQAVLAHPARYKLGKSSLRRLLGELRELGAAGLEIATPSQTPAEIEGLAALALRLGLCGSVGSDFHGASAPYRELGAVPSLPPGVEPVWDRF